MVDIVVFQTTYIGLYYCKWLKYSEIKVYIYTGYFDFEKI